MGNGFIVMDEIDWEGQNAEQRDWLIFKTLKSIDGRLQKLEKMQWTYKAFAAGGGFVGGMVAVFGMKWCGL